MLRRELEAAFGADRATAYLDTEAHDPEIDAWLNEPIPADQIEKIVKHLQAAGGRIATLGATKARLSALLNQGSHVRALQLLAERYVDETGLSIDAAATAASIHEGQGLYAPAEGLSAEDLERVEELEQLHLEVAQAAAVLVANGADADLPTDILDEEDEKLLRTRVREGGTNPLEMVSDLLVIRAASRALSRLRVHAVPDAAAHDHARDLLDGSPSVREWLETEGLPVGLSAQVTTELLRRQNDDLRERLSRTEQLLEESESERKELAKKAARALELGDRITLPRTLIGALRDDSSSFEALAERVDQKELFPDSPSTVAILQEARADLVDRQFRDATTSEIRALVAVFRIASSLGDNGRVLTSPIHVPANLFFDAAEIDLRQGKLRRDVFNGLARLSTRLVTVSYTFPDVDESTGEKTGKTAVIGDRTQVCNVKPIWRGRSQAEATRIGRAWTRWMEHSQDEEWGEDLPDEMVIALPPLMQPVLKALTLSARILERLDQGAKQVRGKNQGFLPIDFALYLEATQTVQSGQLDDSGGSLKSFVKRDEFILGQFGADRVKKDRAKGRYTKRLVSQYETAVEVLKAAGLVLSYESQRPGRRGERDVFVLNPEFVHGLEDRARRALDRDQLRLAAGDS